MPDIFDRRSPVQMPAPGGDVTGSRFETCRWHANPDNGGAPYCAHRDVLPYAGTNGFNPEAWCPDCRFFKMRRGARKQARYLTDDF